MARDCLFNNSCKAYGTQDCNSNCYPYRALYGSPEKDKTAYRFSRLPVRITVIRHSKEFIRVCI